MRSKVLAAIPNATTLLLLLLPVRARFEGPGWAAVRISMFPRSRPFPRRGRFDERRFKALRLPWAVCCPGGKIVAFRLKVYWPRQSEP